MSLNSAINDSENEAKSEEFIDVIVKGDSKIEETNNFPLKTKAILERNKVNSKFKRVKRQGNQFASN